MDDDALLRYSRHIMLPDVEIDGQQALIDSTVVVIGLGGLGSPAAVYLAASGVGKLVLVDDDVVELSNLQRQIAHSEAHIGAPKTKSAQAHIAALNSMVRVDTISHRLDAEELAQQARAATVVLDCTDNFSTRFLINDTCWAEGTPVVSGAAIRMEGQLALFDPNVDGAPCYRCLYIEADDGALNCAENGILSPLVGLIGVAQALEAVKHIAKIGPSSAGFVHYFDGKYFEWRKLKLKRRSDCPTCSA